MVTAGAVAVWGVKKEKKLQVMMPRLSGGKEKNNCS
jgi:hypothetical protein